MNQVSIGVVWAVCDHFEGETGKPVVASKLKAVCGVDRTQLRVWERQGRLDVYLVTNARGQREKAYLRPKQRDKDGEKVGEVEHSI